MDQDPYWTVFTRSKMSKAVVYPKRYFRRSVLCPVCGAAVNGYLQTDQENTLLPCYCDCPSLWLSIFAAEMARRVRNKKPRDVQSLFEQAADSKSVEYKKQMANLKAVRDAAIMAGDFDSMNRNECSMLELYQHMQDMLPQDELPKDLQLHDAALKVATVQQLAIPAKNTSNTRIFTISPEKLQLTVLATPTYRNAPAALLRSVAHNVLLQLRQFVSTQQPVGPDVLDLLARICPSCEHFIPCDDSVIALADAAKLQPRRRFIELPTASAAAETQSTPRNRLRDSFPQADADSATPDSF